MFLNIKIFCKYCIVAKKRITLQKLYKPARHLLRSFIIYKIPILDLSKGKGPAAVNVATTVGQPYLSDF